MLDLPQFAPVEVQPKIDPQLGQLAQEIKRENLVAVGVSENADKAHNCAPLRNYPLQELPVRFESARQTSEERGKVASLPHAEGVRPMAELPVPLTRRTLRRGFWLAFPGRAMCRLQPQRP